MLSIPPRQFQPYIIQSECFRRFCSALRQVEVLRCFVQRMVYIILETEAIQQKEFMKAFIERIEMFPEKRKDGSWIRKIVFNFPVPVDGEEVKELPLETETTVESVVTLVKA